MATVRYFIFLSLFATLANAQNRVAFELTDSLHEVSGMATDGRYVWMINDSGNDPLLFEYFGEEYRGAYPVQAKNIDWEALTSDVMGNLYICDIGNNANDRNTRVIYKINKRQLNHQFDTLVPETLNVFIPETFPPAENKRDFDWESAVYKNGALHTFSKNRREPFDGVVIHRTMTSTEVTQDTAMVVDSTRMGNLVREAYWITDACLSADRRHLFLLSSRSVTCFLDFPETRFFDGYKIIIPLNEISQKESITAWNDSTLLIADEVHPVFGGGNVYTLHLNEYLEEYFDSRRHEVELETKSLDSTLRFTVDPLVDTKVYVSLYSDNGTLVLSRLAGEAQRGRITPFEIDVRELPVGHYILNIQDGRVPHGFFVHRKARAEDFQSIDQER